MAGLAAAAAVVTVVLAGPVAGGGLVLAGTILTPNACAGVASTRAAGTQLDAEQAANATTIIATTALLRLPARAAVIAVATAMRESSLRNLNYGDAAGPDSRGLFQQRTRYYGADVATDPAKATTAFLTRLTAVPGWATLPLTVAAAAVQRPRADLVGAYAQWEQLATDLVTRTWAGPLTTGWTTTGPADLPRPAPVCDTSTDAAMPGTGGLPTGYLLPTATQGAVAVRQALAQLGKPYVWGGVGPNGYDCSGLTVTAWAAAGIAIPRTAAAQATAGVPITSVGAMQPGDLIFIAGSHGTPSAPGHLGMYIGTTNGVQYLVHAPHTGTTVQIRPVSAWSSLIVAIRRPVSQ